MENASLAMKLPLMLQSARSYHDHGFESIEEDLEHQLLELYRDNVLTSDTNCEAVVFYCKM
jgi:hypothetical protein